MEICGPVRRCDVACMQFRPPGTEGVNRALRSWLQRRASRACQTTVDGRIGDAHGIGDEQTRRWPGRAKWCPRRCSERGARERGAFTEHAKLSGEKRSRTMLTHVHHVEQHHPCQTVTTATTSSRARWKAGSKGHAILSWSEHLYTPEHGVQSS